MQGMLESLLARLESVATRLESIPSGSVSILRCSKLHCLHVLSDCLLPKLCWLRITLLYLQGHASAGPPPAAPTGLSAVHQPAATAGQPATTGAATALVQEYDRLTQPALAALVQAAAPLQPEVRMLTAAL